MKMVMLKNGSEEAEVSVRAICLSLQELFDSAPVILYELVMKCRDSKHEFFGDSGKKLQDLSLVDGDTIHRTIKNIVLSAVVGEGFEMKLTPPIA